MTALAFEEFARLSRKQHDAVSFRCPVGSFQTQRHRLWRTAASEEGPLDEPSDASKVITPDRLHPFCCIDSYGTHAVTRGCTWEVHKHRAQAPANVPTQHSVFVQSRGAWWTTL